MDDRKRDREGSPSLTPPGKALKHDTEQDISIIPLNDMVATQTSVKLLSPTKVIDGERLYQLYLKLEAKVCNQERDIATLNTKLTKKEETITKLEERATKSESECLSLRKSIAELERKSNTELDTVKASIKKVEDKVPREETGALHIAAGDLTFLETLKREYPGTSEGLAIVEGKISTLTSDITKLQRNISDFENKLNKGGEASVQADGGDMQNSDISNELRQITEAQAVMVKENRKRHLEGDKRDQYTMRDSVRVTGVPFKRDEDTNSLIIRIAHSIGVEISNQDISVSHRTGRRVEGQPRAIICRFTRRDTKYRLLRNKKLARNITRDDDGNPVRIFIDEKLTPMRARVCKLLREEKVQHHTQDGKIFITDQDTSEWKVLDTPEEWEQWDKTDEVKMELGIYPRV